MSHIDGYANDGLAQQRIQTESETEARSKYLAELRVTFPSLGRLTCDLVAFVAAGGDSDLVVCRGYIVLPNQGLFMEHWWTRRARRDLVFDPLLNLFTGGCKVERVEISGLPASAYEGVGSFDCLAMSGPCSRAEKTLPDCEWCIERKRLETLGMKAYELQVYPQPAYSRVKQ